MSGLLFFIPGRSRPVPSGQVETLPDDLDLRALLRDAAWSVNVDVRGGPGGRDGVMLSLHPAPQSGGREAIARYVPDEQTWAPRGDWSIGWYNAQRPGPQDLMQRDHFEGWPVTLRGDQWIVPVVHAPLATIPMRMMPLEGGVFGPRPAPEYEDLMRLAERLYSLLVDGGRILEGELFEFCAAVLALNYRVDPWLCSGAGLDLVRTADFGEIARVAIGLRSVAEQLAAQKKTDAPENSDAI